MRPGDWTQEDLKVSLSVGARKQVVVGAGTGLTVTATTQGAPPARTGYRSTVVSAWGIHASGRVLLARQKCADVTEVLEQEIVSWAGGAFDSFEVDIFDDPDTEGGLITPIECPPTLWVVKTSGIAVPCDHGGVVKVESRHITPETPTGYGLTRARTTEYALPPPAKLRISPAPGRRRALLSLVEDEIAPGDVVQVSTSPTLRGVALRPGNAARDATMLELRAGTVLYVTPAPVSAYTLVLVEEFS